MGEMTWSLPWCKKTWSGMKEFYSVNNRHPPCPKKNMLVAIAKGDQKTAHCDPLAAQKGTDVEHCRVRAAGNTAAT